MNDSSMNPQSPTPPAPAPPPPPIAYTAAPAAWTPLPAGAKNPGAAGALGIIPGMGHLYLGLYQRAAILFAVWVLLISLSDHSRGPFPGIAIPFWMVFSIIDAVRQAKAINATGKPEANILGADEPDRRVPASEPARADRPVLPERLVAHSPRRLRRVAGVPPLQVEARGLLTPQARSAFESSRAGPTTGRLFPFPAQDTVSDTVSGTDLTHHRESCLNPSALFSMI